MRSLSRRRGSRRAEAWHGHRSPDGEGPPRPERSSVQRIRLGTFSCWVRCSTSSSDSDYDWIRSRSVNYEDHYLRLVEKAKRRISSLPLEGYIERHHVIPHCLGGGDEATNIVDLTAEEHFVAHELLVKMYPGIPALTWTLVRMSAGPSSPSAPKWKNKLYGWRKRAFLVANSQRMKERWEDPGYRAIQENRKDTPETCAKRSISSRRLWRSDEYRLKVSAALTGIKRTPEYIAKMKARVYPAAAKAKVSAMFKGRPKTRESIEKMKATKRANGSGIGKPHKKSAAALANQVRIQIRKLEAELAEVRS